MKQYIVKLSCTALALLSLQGVAQAQSLGDSTTVDLVELPFGQLEKDRVVGSVDVITNEQLMHFAGTSVQGAMQGNAVGYALGRIRGYSRAGAGDQPLIVIDGLSNRSLASLTLEEVETITILKDVTAKMLYGSRAANGVIVVKTKRGYNGKRKFSVTGEYGVQNVNQYPDYAGAADYMKYRNQALLNDGKTALYSEEKIQNAGLDYKNPDVDFYDYFLKDQKTFQTINAQLQGGDKKTQYFLNIGYVGANGLEKVGDVSHTDALNVRSNLDYKVNDVMSVNMDIAARMFLSSGNLVGNDIYSKVSGSKPNDYSIFISDVPHVDSLGTSDRAGGKNLYGDMVYSGYQNSRTTLAQTNLGLNFDLNKYIKGLSARAYMTFDMNNSVSKGKKVTYRTLKPGTTQSGQDTLIVNGVYAPKAAESKFSDGYYRNMGGGANISYDRTIGNHAIAATASYLIDYKAVKTSKNDDQTFVQDDKGMNFGGRLNYAYKGKYIAELSSSYMGSSRFHADNRWKLFTAAGASWIVSEEDFLKDNILIDYLKLKASAGTIGYDQSFSYLLYEDFYKYWSGSYGTGVKNSDKLIGTELSQSGNKHLSFEESKEMNIGAEMHILGNRLAIDAEYFKEERSGMPTVMKYAVPGMAGMPSYVDNYNAVETEGYELGVQFTDRIGALDISFGGTVTGYKSMWKQYDELNQFAHQNKTGQETDAMWGFVADGFYTTPEDIATYGAQDGEALTSALGNVIVGDLRYKDMSDTREDYNLGDNKINWYDTKKLGNSRPRYIYTLNVHLKYKGLSFYALGQGYGGYDRMATQSYYTNKGDVNYSPTASEAAVPVFNEQGEAIGLENENFSRPRLTSGGSNHSYVASTFYQRKADYFKLRTAEINYSLPKSLIAPLKMSSLDIYVRGNNLLTISDDDYVDISSPNAGITGSPTFTSYLFGVKLGF